MREGRCFVVGAGDLCARGLRPGPMDMLIAADGGYAGLQRLGLHPDLVIGDMDSFQGKVMGVPLLRFPVRKDDTDLSLAVKAGKSQGYRRFVVYGASGGVREDHFLAALQLMAGQNQQGLHIRLVAPSFDVYALHNASLLIPTQAEMTVSVFSHSVQSLGVTLKGLQYEAENLRLQSGFPLGVSNQAKGSRALIGVKKGTLLIWVQSAI